MYRKFSANKIYPVSAAPIENGVVVTDEQGKILSVDTAGQHDTSEVESFDGILVPGFINTHCHLELSHLKGIAQTGTGLIDFITQVIKNRNHPQEVIQHAIEQEETNMLQCGIVAVGDISNTTDTFLQKQKGNLHYYTFVEYFDLFQENNTDNIITQYDAVYNSLQVTEKNKIAKVPHAPYSVSHKLFSAIASEARHSFEIPTISIHNQETLAENELFQSGTGGFVDFYNAIGYATDNIPVSGNSSIHYALEYLQRTNRNLLVHNTLSTKADIEAAELALGKENTFWATCPNANLYIENRLPDYRNFLESGAQVCIGTDSLTSNWQLSILEEMKTILKYQSYLDFETVLKWATLNGAAALGFDRSLGSIETGKTPGLVLIEHMEHGCITGRTTSKRIL